MTILEDKFEYKMVNWNHWSCSDYDSYSFPFLPVPKKLIRHVNRILSEYTEKNFCQVKLQNALSAVANFLLKESPKEVMEIVEYYTLYYLRIDEENRYRCFKFRKEISTQIGLSNDDSKNRLIVIKLMVTLVYLHYKNTLIII